MTGYLKLNNCEQIVCIQQEYLMSFKFKLFELRVVTEAVRVYKRSIFSYLKQSISQQTNDNY